jgi:hypothetical protein
MYGICYGPGENDYLELCSVFALDGLMIEIAQKTGPDNTRFASLYGLQQTIDEAADENVIAPAWLKRVKAQAALALKTATFSAPARRLLTDLTTLPI